MSARAPPSSTLKQCGTSRGPNTELAWAARELGVPATEADLPIEDVERFVLPVVDVEWSRHSGIESHVCQSETAAGLCAAAFAGEEIALPPDDLWLRKGA